MKNITLNKTSAVTLGLILIVLGITTRLTPHLPNFTPLNAIAIFSGFYSRNLIGYLIVFLTMLISDTLIGFYDLKLMIAVYLSFFASNLIGLAMEKRPTLIAVSFYATTSSIVFYLTTNFAVWIFSSWYPHNFNGLLASYLMELPFLKNMLLADIIYSIALFQLYFLVTSIKKRYKLTLNYRYWLKFGYLLGNTNLLNHFNYLIYILISFRGFFS